MVYQSVDELQKLLVKDVFHYADDAKKAAGRALGTLVEIITFYTLKSWGLEHNTAIERPLPEFANAEITHNVEYSLHAATIIENIAFDRVSLPMTAKKILKSCEIKGDAKTPRTNVLLSRLLALRNACTICDLGDRFLNAYLDDLRGDKGRLTVAALRRRPFAIFECKRVGIEEGNKKGPQTIEKAKQGAYVARTVSSLQRIRFADGKLGGLIQEKDGSIHYGEYYTLLNEIIASSDPELLSHFVLTVGVVSNHGNWFTSDNHNKELKVLAQSYDWLLFLTDEGLSQFISEVLLRPDKRFAAARESFLASYTGKKGSNQFTKVKVALAADTAIQEYFKEKARIIEGWFNVIAPPKKGLAVLREDLRILKSKQWERHEP
jgi:hypothetical protein